MSALLLELELTTRRGDLIVLGILVVGLATFLIGAYYVYLPPRGILEAPSIFFYALISFIIGLAASYFFVKLRKKYTDLAL